MLNLLHFKSFVQTSTARAAGKQCVCSILKFERTNHAAQPILQSPSLPPPAIPFSHYPEEKNRRKKKQQINRDQGGETDANHGVALPAGFVCERAMSLPHSIVEIPQVKNASGLSSPGAFVEKWQRTR
jgi:hypothetical protein